MGSKRFLRLVEFCQWVIAASTAVVAVFLGLGLVVGGDLLTGKYFLFVVGFLLFGIGTIMVQPTRPQEAAQLDHADGRGSGRIGGGQPGLSGAEDDRDRGFDEQSLQLSALRKRVQLQRSREHPSEAKLVAIGPISARQLPFDDRVGRGPKVFVTGLVVLAVSLLLEIAGVQI
ncbi:MAG: hypothetical protein V5A43_08425 [Haloarculaceae archaeon]